MLHWLFVGQSHLTNYIGGRIDFTLYDVRIAQRNRYCLSSSFYSTSIFGWHCVLLAQLFKPASLANGNTVTHLTLSSPRTAVEGPHNRSPLLRDRELLAITSCVVATGTAFEVIQKGELLSARAVWCIIYRPIVFCNQQGKQIRLMRFNGNDNRRESFMFYLHKWASASLACETQERWVRKEDPWI